MKYCILSILLCTYWWVNAQLPGYGQHGWSEHIATACSIEEEIYGNPRLQLFRQELLFQRPGFPLHQRTVQVQETEKAIASLSSC